MLLINYQTFSSQLGGPFGFCAFALLSELLLGSLVIALKCTRPRQRFMYVVGRYSMTEGGICQEGKSLGENLYFLYFSKKFSGTKYKFPLALEHAT